MAQTMYFTADHERCGHRHRSEKALVRCMERIWRYTLKPVPWKMHCKRTDRVLNSGQINFWETSRGGKQNGSSVQLSMAPYRFRNDDRIYFSGLCNFPSSFHAEKSKSSGLLHERFSNSGIYGCRSFRNTLLVPETRSVNSFRSLFNRGRFHYVQ